MTIPSRRDPLLPPLRTDEEVLARVDRLIGFACDRRLWLMLVGSDGVQLPQLLPMDLPRSVRRRDLGAYSAFLHTIAAASGAASIVVVLERPGDVELSAADVGWFRFVLAAARAAELPVRGPLLSSTAGVRWIAPEDWAPAGWLSATPDPDGPAPGGQPPPTRERSPAPARRTPWEASPEQPRS
jgi:hypothetical protein